jgi:hypothetical protein
MQVANFKFGFAALLALGFSVLAFAKPPHLTTPLFVPEVISGDEMSDVMTTSSIVKPTGPSCSAEKLKTNVSASAFDVSQSIIGNAVSQADATP